MFLFKKICLTVFFIIFIFSFNYSQELKSRSIDSIIGDIRKEQKLKEKDKINPDKISPKLLDELGDAVMDQMIGNSGSRELMDQMMGGEGSESLTAMHKRIGYNYLTGNINVNGNMMGRNNGMMNGYPFNNKYDKKGGYPMMWNNGHGMMGGWGFGGWIAGFIFLIIVIAVILAIFILLKNKGIINSSSSKESPLDILKKRYAKGELSKKDFDKMKKDIL